VLDRKGGDSSLQEEGAREKKGVLFSKTEGRRKKEGKIFLPIKAAHLLHLRRKKIEKKKGACAHFSNEKKKEGGPSFPPFLLWGKLEEREERIQPCRRHDAAQRGGGEREAPSFAC